MMPNGSLILLLMAVLRLVFWNDHDRQMDTALYPSQGICTLELWVMRGTCYWSALLLRILGMKFLHWLQTAQVSWPGLCGPLMYLLHMRYQHQPMVSRHIIACLDRMSC